MTLAQQHQSGGSLQPLSMVLLFTPKEVTATTEEMYFRRRAMELSEEMANEVLWEDAIVSVVYQLIKEGLCVRISGVNQDLIKLITDQIGEEGRSTNRIKLIIIYHYLIWKTAPLQTWTLPRKIGDQRVIPFHPRLLQVTKMTVACETCVNGDSLSFEEPGLRQEVAKLLEDSDCWKEVSILEFVNASMSEDFQLVGPRSQPVTYVISRKDRTLTWRDAQDDDNIRGEEVFKCDDGGESINFYVRTEGDVRKLYENRPEVPETKNMVLGQFASQYRKVKATGHGYESALEKIDSVTSVGPASIFPVAGSEIHTAPICMKLKNGTIMQMRSGPKAVLHLLSSGAPGRHGNQLLWSTWTYLEQVSGDQEVEESDLQKKKRLSIFPLSVIPSLSSNVIP